MNLKNLMGTSNPLAGMVIQDIAKSESGYNYYGFLNCDGVGIILRENTAETEYRIYVTKSFSTDWGNRGSLTSYTRIA